MSKCNCYDFHANSSNYAKGYQWFTLPVLLQLLQLSFDWVDFHYLPPGLFFNQFSQMLIPLEDNLLKDILLKDLFSDIHVAISGEINHTLPCVLYKFFLDLQAVSQFMEKKKIILVLLMRIEDKGAAQKRAGSTGGIIFFCPQHQWDFITTLQIGCWRIVPNRQSLALRTWCYYIQLNSIWYIYLRGVNMAFSRVSIARRPHKSCFQLRCCNS